MEKIHLVLIWLAGISKICCTTKSNGGNLCSFLCHQDKTDLELFGSIENRQNPTSSLEPLLFCVLSIKKTL
jgi:hypothetical protein